MGVMLEPIQNIVFINEMNNNEMNNNEMNINEMNNNEMNPYLIECFIDPKINSIINSILLEQQKYINEYEELLWFLTMITIYLSPIVISITKICSFHSL